MGSQLVLNMLLLLDESKKPKKKGKYFNSYAIDSLQLLQLISPEYERQYGGGHSNLFQHK